MIDSLAVVCRIYSINNDYAIANSICVMMSGMLQFPRDQEELSKLDSIAHYNDECLATAKWHDIDQSEQLYSDNKILKDLINAGHSIKYCVYVHYGCAVYFSMDETKLIACTKVQFIKYEREYPNAVKTFIIIESPKYNEIIKFVDTHDPKLHSYVKAMVLLE